jgi:hypothetical protein
MASVTIDQVQSLAKQLSPSDQLRLVEELARELREHQGPYPPDFPLSASATSAAVILPKEDFSDWERK